MNAVSEPRPNCSSDSARSANVSLEVKGQSVAQLCFPGWQIPVKPKMPLNLENVQAIYDRINWSCAVDKLDQQGRQYGAYGQKAPIPMCKALALPYVTLIPSLTELARRLDEYDSYRVTCGFRGRSPTRAMLWHFQYAPLPREKGRRRKGEIDGERKTWFYEILYHILIRAVIVGHRLDLNLPFHYTEQAPELFEADDASTQIMLEFQEYPNLEFHLIHQKEAYFPVLVHVFESEQPVHSYIMQPPAWWEEETVKQSRYDDGGESRSIRQSTACSAIILSRDNKILLGRRKAGYKPGHYALPGGRWRPGETLKECVEREVREETGLQVTELYPMSISFNRYEDGHPECWSVGTLVTEFEGQVTLREPEKCEGWDWYDLDALPQPMFPPSQIIIDAHLSGRSPNLTWEQVEHRIEPTPVAQLRLPL